jgi:hypothetical protein
VVVHAYENKDLQQDFLKGKSQNVYKALMDEVMEDLMKRDIAIRDIQTIAYESFYMNRCRMGHVLTLEKCNEVLKYGRGDQKLFDELFPIV